MSKPVSTAFVLSPEEDAVLRVEAAKAGLSKTKMAQQIIKDWISSQGDNTTIRQRITNIASRISERNPKDKESLFDALDKIITYSCDLIEVQVKLGEGELLGPADAKHLEVRKKDILIRLTADIETINLFCELEGLTLLTKDSSEEFACEIVKEYFETRAK